MNFQDNLYTISLIISVSFGVWGIVAILKRRDTGRITFVEENTIGLFSSKALHFPGIKIRYGDKDLTEQVVYLKGSLINTGNSDLSTNDSHTLKIKIPTNFKCINCKISGHSKEVKCSIDSTGNYLMFDFELLKRNEYLEFEVLLEFAGENISISTSDLIKSLEFSHRIPNTASVVKRKLASKDEIKNKRRDFLMYSIIGGAFLLFLVVMSALNYTKNPQHIKFKYFKDSIEYLVTVNPQAKERIQLNDDERGFSETIPLIDFNKQSNLKAVIADSTFLDKLTIYEGSVLLIVSYLLYGFFAYLKIYRHKKILNILESS